MTAAHSARISVAPARSRRGNPVIEMTRSASPSFLGKEFDDFLFAPVGEDTNGMSLSVLSVLARMDIDPWQEAAALSGLPGKSATRRLASLIEALPDVPSARRDPATTAARLIALLPSRVAAGTVPRKTFSRFKAAPQLRAILIAVFIVLAMSAQYYLAQRQAPDGNNAPHVPAIGTPAPQTQ